MLVARPILCWLAILRIGSVVGAELCVRQRQITEYVVVRFSGMRGRCWFGRRM